MIPMWAIFFYVAPESWYTDSLRRTLWYDQESLAWATQIFSKILKKRPIASLWGCSGFCEFKICVISNMVEAMTQAYYACVIALIIFDILYCTHNHTPLRDLTHLQNWFIIINTHTLEHISSFYDMPTGLIYKACGTHHKICSYIYFAFFVFVIQMVLRGMMLFNHWHLQHCSWWCHVMYGESAYH